MAIKPDDARSLLTEALFLLGGEDGDAVAEFRRNVRKFLESDKKAAEQVLGEALRDARQSRRIVCAAIVSRDVMYSIPAPARHCDIVQHVLETTGQPIREPQEEGFLDDTGRFLDRRAAKIVAQQAGQILDNGVPQLDELFSENVW